MQNFKSPGSGMGFPLQKMIWTLLENEEYGARLHISVCLTVTFTFRQPCYLHKQMIISLKSNYVYYFLKKYESIFL